MSMIYTDKVVDDERLKKTPIITLANKQDASVSDLLVSFL
jgi:hypothetical protein